jgi:phage tail-like protein
VTIPELAGSGPQDAPALSLVGAQARELARVRVSFDADVTQDDPSALGDALNPAGYTLARLTAPAVDATVIGVEPVASSAVDLVTSVQLTPGASYRVDVAGVAGVVNPLAASSPAPSSSATFTGFVPPQPANRRFDLFRFLPELNRREDTTGDLRRFVACLQEVTDLLVYDVDRFTDILDVDLAPEPTLDLMMGELANPFAFDFSEADKRRLVNNLVGFYRQKGTAVGITNAIRFLLGLEVQLTSYADEALMLGESALGDDWVLGPSTMEGALAFEIVAPRVLDAEERRRLLQIVDLLRPAQTHFARLVEPVPPEQIDHLELDLSELGDTWTLH